MTVERHKELLLKAISEGRHDGKIVPTSYSHSRRSGRGFYRTESVEPAASSIELQILHLAVNGDITPQQFFGIYPNVNELRMYLTRTSEAFVSLDSEFAAQVNELLLFGMSEIPGWD